jgi:anaerobic selenocysteine-containing dehydrogenase
MTNSVLEKNAIVRGLCPHDCPDTCALLTTVENGRAVKVQGNPEHKHTDGVLCTKVSRYTERTYSPERLMFPLKRSGPKGSGQFVRVSWEEAIADIAAKLKTIAAGNPEAILPYSYGGTMGWVQSESMASRFFHKIGASLLDRTICASAGGEGLVYTLGGKFGMQTEFFSESKLIVIWGSIPSPATSTFGAVLKRPNATAPSSFALTPATARLLKNAMCIWPSSQAPMPHWPLPSCASCGERLVRPRLH